MPESLQNKPYPRPTVTSEPSLNCLRMLDTNVLLDALYANRLRFGEISPWFSRLLRNAPEGRILICSAVTDEFLHVTQNSPLLAGGQKLSAQQAVAALESIVRFPSVRVVPNANPPLARFNRALLAMRAAPQRRAITDLRIAFTAVQHGAIVCTADIKDYGAIKEALRRLKFYDPLRLG